MENGACLHSKLEWKEPFQIEGHERTHLCCPFQLTNSCVCQIMGLQRGMFFIPAWKAIPPGLGTIHWLSKSLSSKGLPSNLSRHFGRSTSWEPSMGSHKKGEIPASRRPQNNLLVRASQAETHAVYQARRSRYRQWGSKGNTTLAIMNTGTPLYKL